MTSHYNTLNIHNKGDYHIIEIDNGKVNAINLELATDLLHAFNEYHDNEAVKGLIITGRTNCFSAGLDVMEMAKGGIDWVEKFWRIYPEALTQMIKYPKPFIAALTGYAPAGATAIALCADYRIMAEGKKHNVGLHEFKMSLYVPEIMCEIYAFHLGPKRAWEAIQSGRLFNSEEAISAGLVNESLPAQEVLARAEELMQVNLNVLPYVYAEAKKCLRKDLLTIANQDLEVHFQNVKKNVSRPENARMLKAFMDRLSKK